MEAISLQTYFIKGSWYAYYDGLREYQQASTGICKKLVPMATVGYQRSMAIYARD